jgi:hypothetical protein
VTKGKPIHGEEIRKVWRNQKRNQRAKQRVHGQRCDGLSYLRLLIQGRNF